ncbi:hypothetical protein [Falsirhodobacter deserti]|uniref:hypothetical protein n=1 Tax=Falsirhodobacter deserti TaxID=1365611 RepID=UPI000FE4084D|nr:hypothetical protein [Falsirhodobacter deserti]
MSNSDNFMGEVAEELRRERMVGALKRYGWIAVVVVLGIAGGAAWVEWERQNDQASSRAFGDTLLAALETDTPEARRAALDGVTVEGERAALVNLLQASDPDQDKAATLAALDAVIADTSLPAVIHDLAVLRKVIVAGSDLAVQDRQALLQPLTSPGQPYRPLAMEQAAYLHLEAGETQQAIEALQALLGDQQAMPDLRQRITQVITALGGSTTTG